MLCFPKMSGTAIAVYARPWLIAINITKGSIRTWYVKKSLAAKMRLLPKVCVACIFNAWISLGNASSSPYNIIHVIVTKHNSKSWHSSMHKDDGLSHLGTKSACTQSSATSWLMRQEFPLFWCHQHILHGLLVHNCSYTKVRY